jgi:hypothetical protein
MYATIVMCELRNGTAALGHEQAGRTLTAALAALPGFVAFVALDTDAMAGTVTAVCLVEERAGLADAERVIAQWQREQGATRGSDMRRVGAGEVIAQRGL